MSQWQAPKRHFSPTPMLKGLLGIKSGPTLVFSVELDVKELSNLTLSSGRVYISWKVLGGIAKSSGSTRRQTVSPNPKANGFAAFFNETFHFNVKIRADPKTLVLEDEVVRFRVFHESRSGRLFNELGRVFVNLSEYTGSEPKRDKAYLLQKSKINGTVVVAVGVERISGFPTYKVPTNRDSRVVDSDLDDDDLEEHGVSGSGAASADGPGSGEGTLSVEMLQNRKVRLDEHAIGRHTPVNHSRSHSGDDSKGKGKGKSNISIETSSTPFSSIDPPLNLSVEPNTPGGSVRRRVGGHGRAHIRNVSALAGRADVRLSVAISESKFGGGGDADDVVGALLASPEPNAKDKDES